MAKIGTFKCIEDLLKAFPTEKSCIDYLESKLGPKGVIISPFDSTSKVYRRGDGLFRCKNTGKNFNVRKGTMFEGTKLPLRTWFIAIYLITTTKKVVASTTLAQQLGVTQKTAWGESENAVRIQIHVSIITYCLVAITEHGLNIGRPVFEVTRILGTSLLIKDSIRELFQRCSDEVANDGQLELNFNC